MSEKAIGVFDSGMGGVSTLIEIRKLLPRENIIYFADSGFCPYGVKPLPVVRKRVLAVAEYFLNQNAKVLVIACNTACTAALDAVRERFPLLPVIGIEPAIKPGVEATGNKKIGVLATALTLRGDRVLRLIDKYGVATEVFKMPAPDLVTLVERGIVSGPEAEFAVDKYLQPLLRKGIDTLILGCTHFPFLRPLIEKRGGANLKIIDTGVAIARQTLRVLEKDLIVNTNQQPGIVRFITTGDSAAVRAALGCLWPELVNKVDRVEI